MNKPRLFLPAAALAMGLAWRLTGPATPAWAVSTPERLARLKSFNAQQEQIYAEREACARQIQDFKKKTVEYRKKQESLRKFQQMVKDTPPSKGDANDMVIGEVQSIIRDLEKDVAELLLMGYAAGEDSPHYQSLVQRQALLEARQAELAAQIASVQAEIDAPPSSPADLTEGDLAKTDREILDELSPPPARPQPGDDLVDGMFDALLNADLSNAFGDSADPGTYVTQPPATPAPPSSAPDFSAISAAAASQYPAPQNVPSGPFYPPVSGAQWQQQQSWQNHPQSFQHSQQMLNQQLQNMNQMMQPQMQWGQRPPPSAAPPPAAGSKPPSTQPPFSGSYREVELMGGYNIDGTPIKPILMQIPNVGP